MNNKDMGLILGGMVGSQALGYYLGARKLLALYLGVPLTIALTLKAFGYEASPPKPYEPPACVRYEVKEYSVLVSLFPAAVVHTSGPVCVEWEAKK